MAETTATNAIEIARELAQQFATRATEADRRGQLPAEDVQALRESGYVALSVPQDYGGAGLSLRDCVAVQLELAQGSGSTAVVAAMPLQVFGHARETTPWPQRQFERLCREAGRGRLFNSVASEPVLGSPSRGGLFQTEAVYNDDRWIINGHKNWASGGPHLDYLLLSVTVEGDTGLLLVPNHSQGMTWEPTWQAALSLRASDSHDVYFKDVAVPASNLITRSDRSGPKPPPNAWFPMILAATYLGVAIAARNAAIMYALDRVPTALGKPIATLPKIQRAIGEIDLELQAAGLLLLNVAGTWTGTLENRRTVYPRIVAAKYLATETAISVTDKCLRVAGGQGVTGALPLERYFRDVRGGLAHPPSADAALEMIGQHAIEQFKQGQNG